MPALRSDVTTQGRNAAGARSLWRATGMVDEDFGKPIVAIANSSTQFVPGHVHLKDVGDIVAAAVREAGGVPREFHTIAVDDGIAMGHGGMLYSLPSREVIADAVEYMVNGHAADALVGRSRRPTGGRRSTPMRPAAASMTSRMPTPPMAVWRSFTATSRGTVLSERPWQPRDRNRPVSKALRAYAALATSAHTGAVRNVP